MKLRNHVIFMALLALSSLYVLTVNHFTTTSPPVFLSEDETIDSFYIELYSATGRLFYVEELNAIADGFVRPSLLTIELTIDEQSRISPRGYLGMIVAYGAVSGFVNEPTLTTVMGCFGLIFLYVLARHLFDIRAALISSFLLATLPQYLYHSRLFLQNNIPATVFLVAALLYFLKAYNASSRKHFILSAIFFGICSSFRYEYLAIFLFTSLVFLIKHARMEGFSLDKKALSSFITAILFFTFFISPVLIANNDLYGSPLKMGEIVYRERYLADFLSDPKAVFVDTFSFDALRTNFLIEFLRLYPLQPLFTTFAIFGLFSRRWSDSVTRIFCIVFVFIVLYLAILFGGSETYYGFGVATLRASYVRYFLPVYVLSLPLISSFLSEAKSKERSLILGLIIFLTVTSTFGSAITEMNSVNSWLNVMKQVSDKILAKTPKDAVIVSMDVRVIFPQRKVATYDPLLVGPQEVADNMLRLYENNVPVYFFETDEESRKVGEVLEKSGFTLTPIDIQLYTRQLYVLSAKP